MSEIKNRTLMFRIKKLMSKIENRKLAGGEGVETEGGGGSQLFEPQKREGS